VSLVAGRGCPYPLLPVGDDEFEQARNAAYSTVSQVVELLRSRLWK
jgi:hypothetical protein